MVVTKASSKDYRLLRIIDAPPATPETVIVHLEPVDGIPLPFDPGKYAVISGVEKVVDASGKETTEMHKGWGYSVASAPGSAFMELFVVKEHLKADGKGGQVTHKTHFLDARPGDIFKVNGPLGPFTLLPDDGNKVLLLAAGTGLAAEIPMLRQWAEQKRDVNVAIVYSVKRENEIIYAQELSGLVERLNAKITITVTRPAESPGWKGRTGHISRDLIDDVAKEVKKDPDTNRDLVVTEAKDRMCFICGPRGFVDSVTTMLGELRVPSRKIRTDPWG